MGTSRGYGAPTGGGWPSLKRQVTGFGADGGGEPLPPLPPFPDPAPPPSPPPPNPQTPSPLQVLANYISANGGAIAMSGIGSAISGGRGEGGRSGGRAGTGGGGGSGTSRRPIRAAARVGRDLGRLASRVQQAGLTETLREFGLADLIGRPAGEVAMAIVDRLAGPGSSMDASLARIALSKLWQELLGAAQTYEDVQQALQGTVERVEAAGLLVQYYGHYLFERFNRDFYERLVKSAGVENARKSIESIKRTIFASLRAKIAGRDPVSVDWRGDEGAQLSETILLETLQIFEAGT